MNDEDSLTEATRTAAQLLFDAAVEAPDGASAYNRARDAVKDRTLRDPVRALVLGAVADTLDRTRGLSTFDVLMRASKALDPEPNAGADA